MQIKCITIDDEPLALSKLEGFISRVPGIQLVNSFDNPLEAMVWIRENPVDLVFLDIRMEQLTGIEFLEATSPSCCVIITTAYEQYALKGYDLNITDYLLKPYSFERFVRAVNKGMDQLSARNRGNRNTEEDNGYLFVKTEYRLEKVNTGEILYIEGMKDYLRIVCTGKKIMTLMSFAKMEEMLPSDKFCRIHKSYMVAVSKIDSVERGVVIIGGKRMPVSLTYREDFYSRINASSSCLPGKV